MAEATSVTTSACSSTPANRVPELAPTALSTPYRPVRSTVISAKNSATTTVAITTVIPMIWLKTVRCWDTPGSCSIAWSIVRVEVAPSVAASIAVASEAGASCTTSACTTPSPTRPEGRLAASTVRQVSREPHSVPCPE